MKRRVEAAKRRIGSEEKEGQRPGED